MNKVGFRGLLHRSAPLPFETRQCLRVEGQARFHPTRYLWGSPRSSFDQAGVFMKGLASCRSRRESRVYWRPNTACSSGRVIVAANVADHEPPFVNTKIAPYRSYVLGVRLTRGFRTRCSGHGAPAFLFTVSVFHFFFYVFLFG